MNWKELVKATNGKELERTVNKLDRNGMHFVKEFGLELIG